MPTCSGNGLKRSKIRSEDSLWPWDNYRGMVTGGHLGLPELFENIVIATQHLNEMVPLVGIDFEGLDFYTIDHWKISLY